ncbi:hypothetical protein UA08_05515 [Talaromyces atroroseus]|uniref:Altered inheritance of mitochondria protein 9, mitochondrial n=1 Tax=Talaromyces atroroseus TaxID=1441469 RepID=A0A225ADJ6_TALAT|nr:hypothetical protein UA08_05515 [Talaromyces atroroseus]OKL59252.1 hypothetical protein UA08_05515 [Talaromyces atroroseus]
MIYPDCAGAFMLDATVASIDIRTNNVQGNTISKDGLFRYTNGRFLNDEPSQLSKRYVRFDVEKLCDVIANLPGTQKSPVTRISKMEGGFSKALLITTEDTSEYIAKIPCPNAGSPMYCTASEVAVLGFIRDRTTIPVPKVLAWSSDASNAVGAEYIIMEKVPGVQMFQKNFLKSGSRHNGSLYYRISLNENEMILLDSSIDPDGEFCIGPSCDPSWLLQPHQTLSDVKIGPWKTLCDMGESLIDRSFIKVSSTPKYTAPAIPIWVHRRSLLSTSHGKESFADYNQ